MKRLIALISPEGKTAKQLADEMYEAVKKYFEVEKKVLAKRSKKPYLIVAIITLTLAGYFYLSFHKEKELNIPQFRDFPVSEIYKGTPAPVDLNSSPIGNTFRIRLTAAAKAGPNFAGHYTLVELGCGTMCRILAVIDEETGKIYEIPFGSELGTEVRLDSSLLIVNPILKPYGPYSDTPDYLAIQYYQWDGEEFRFLDAYRVSDNQMRLIRIL